MALDRLDARNWLAVALDYERVAAIAHAAV